MEGRGHSRMGAPLCLEVDIDTSLIYLLLASIRFFFSPSAWKISERLLFFFLGDPFTNQTFAKCSSVID